jgi:hypothetical protein
MAQANFHDTETSQIKPLAIDLSENVGLQDKGVELLTLAFADEAVGLQRLMLSSVGMTAKGFIHLCKNGLSKTTSLTALDVSNCQWNHGLLEKEGGEEIKACDSVLSCCKALCSEVYPVRLVDSDVPPQQTDPVEFCSVLSKNMFLRVLCLSNCSITVEGITLLALALRKCPGLEELDLSYNPFGDEGVVQIANTLLWRAEGKMQEEKDKTKVLTKEDKEKAAQEEEVDQRLGLTKVRGRSPSSIGYRSFHLTDVLSICTRR